MNVRGSGGAKLIWKRREEEEEEEGEERQAKEREETRARKSTHTVLGFSVHFFSFLSPSNYLRLGVTKKIHNFYFSYLYSKIE